MVSSIEKKKGDWGDDDCTSDTELDHDHDGND